MGAADTAAFDALEDATTEEELVRSVCEEYGALTRARVQRYLPASRTPTKPDADAGIEAGSDTNRYLQPLLGDYPGRGGKMLRPSLCIAAARAFGAPAEDALATAASIELLHNALLIHDDIQDDSEQRRGAPTLHALHGLPLALNAGDALGLLSLRPLKENLAALGPRLAARIYAETERMAWETTAGQALELGWRRDNRLDLDDEHYLTMVLQKTCWLTTIHPLRTGCLIGTRGRMPLAPLIRLGFFFGAAFQIQDDLLNLEGGAAYGKEQSGDLLEGKRTLMLIHALRGATPAGRARLQRFLAAPRARRRAASVAWVRGQIERSGGLEHARLVARALAGAALYEFDQIFRDTPPSRDRRFLRGLITWVLRRVH